jgi:hypothetical protein
MIFDLDCNITRIDESSFLWNGVVFTDIPFVWVRNSPTVLTYTLDSNYYTSVTGTVRLYDSGMAQYGDAITDGGIWTNYKANSAKSSITF